MSTFDITPDTETMVRVFQEGIDAARRKLDAIEAVEERVDESEEFDHAERELIVEGIYLLIDQENRLVARLSDALDECTLAIRASKALEALTGMMRRGAPIGNSDLLAEIVRLLGALAQKAGMER